MDLYSPTYVAREVETVTSPNLAYVSDTDYHPAGLLWSMTHGPASGVIANRAATYTTGLRRNTMTAGSTITCCNLENRSFLFDLAGNVKSVRDVINANQYQCFGYDHRARLTTAFTAASSACSSYAAVGSGPYNHSYVYDNHGRITSATGVGSYTYTNAAHDGAVTTAGPHSFGYDPAGNMTSRAISGQNTQSLVWDESNRLEQVTQTGSPTVVYLYDADNNRVARRTGTTTTVQIDGLFDWTSNTGLTSYYQHGSENIGYRDSAGMHWQFGDHLTSVSTIFTPGQPLETQRYHPYGTTRTSTGLPTEYGYTSQRLDPTGLYHYRARPYDPITGRFTTPDTIIPTPNNPETLNRYTYTNNNPTTWTDPTGHCASSWDIRHWGRAIEECMGKIDSWAEDLFSTTRKSPVAATTIEATGFRDVWRAAIGTDFETGEAVSPEARRDALKDVATTIAVAGVFNRIIKLTRAITPFLRHTDNTPLGFADSGATTSALPRAEQVADAIDYDSLTFSGTVAGHLDDVAKAGPSTRPYMGSPLTLREITRAADPVPDPGGLANGWRWDVPGTFRGSQGTWELVIDLDTNRVVHWNFTR